ncbi:sigma-70 family RNA polymerase sigma factor [Polyangium aurulentum]|uniref:sigma-70 family RNA polymerase sigma factor n=1 Tax=Polyangium aurulentum TaxID=2567896 RepID=UPI0010AE4578|nr:sigma-70 family RNA polymerase sigma factor [Polyangium aurulentum]UQA55470.1 sigma-70 family RNA polymerase sigma factor [Polyangium aurulentum]
MADIAPHKHAAGSDVAAHATIRSLEEHRVALTGHCYRMLGSISEADDAVQETMVRAWRSLDQFEGRASLRTWLYSIATRVCLDALADRARRARPMELSSVHAADAPLTELPASRWIEPIPDVLALPDDADPDELVTLRQSIRLAFVAALQHLPPKQRAVLLLTEVLDCPATEVAETLDTSVAAVNSALQRARATLAMRDLTDVHAPLSEPQSRLVERYVDAFERYDTAALTSLLHEDATMCMPPFELWLRGHGSIQSFFHGTGAGCRGSRLVPTAACASPAFGQYKPGEPGGPLKAWSLIVLELEGDRIATMTHFLDVQTLFPRFGLPLELA